MRGMPPIPLQALPRVQDRVSFLYLEHCVVHRDEGAITARDAAGIVRIPAASLAVVLLGPGTSISHQAMVLLGDAGASTVWVGERGVRYYAHGRPLAGSSGLIEEQARRVSAPKKRLAVARQMYCMRFEGEDVTNLTMQQLRGREGARVRRLYRENSERTGVEWRRREFVPDDFDSSDPINQALSAAHAALYGVVHSVIVSLGCSPALGFVHSGTSRAFVYDIADLYKAEVTIPVAFDVVAEELADIGAITRRRVRDLIFERHVIERTVMDIQLLLGRAEDEGSLAADVLTLWDYQGRRIAGGQNYAEVPDGW